ncbi:hypothetical protein ACFE04_005625 [Oxalis oulophora]
MGSPRPRRSPQPSTRTTSRRDSPPAREKHLTYARSPKRDLSRSPSPRTKRLRRSQAERESEKVNDREQERNRGRGLDKGAHRGRGDDRDNCSRGDRDFDRHAHRERGLEKSNNGKSSRNEGGLDRDIGKDGKGLERGNGRSLDRETDKDTRKGRSSENERSMERRSERDESKSRRGHSSSPSDRHHRSRNRSRSPQQDADIRGHDKVTNSRGDEKRNDNDDVEDEDESVARMKAAEEALAAKEKEKPSFELSGKLAAETNRVKGITLLFTEPPDARKPDVRWRLYVFKNGEALSEPLYIHRQSCYLFGRERRVADIPTDHPSCSKQHAVIQFRQVEKERPDGTLKKQVRPYVMDLGSTNKTLLNENPIEPERYYELFEKDTIKFGNSSREYVLLHENSA